MIAVGESAGLLRRLGALFYDALLLTAVLMLATGLILLLTGGRAITPQTSGPIAYAYRAFLALLMVLYYGISWVRSGQTLGMRAWKLRVLRANGARLRWSDVLLRLGAAILSWLPFGAGYLWLLIDRERLTWHDRLSQTRVVAA